MTCKTRALIVDDDYDAAEFLRFTLSRQFPEMEIETRDRPDVSGEFDVYFIDNDFEGRRLAAELAFAIRARQPDSLILAFSAHLDATTLKSLINAGCNGAYEKHEHGELCRLLGLVDENLESMERTRRDSLSQGGLVGTIQSITQLLREWNQRLETSAERNRVETPPALEEVA